MCSIIYQTTTLRSEQVHFNNLNAYNLLKCLIYIWDCSGNYFVVNTKIGLIWIERINTDQHVKKFFNKLY